jgi:hypothetical protein
MFSITCIAVKEYVSYTETPLLDILYIHHLNKCSECISMAISTHFVWPTLTLSGILKWQRVRELDAVMHLKKQL